MPGRRPAYVARTPSEHPGSQDLRGPGRKSCRENTHPRIACNRPTRVKIPSEWSVLPSRLNNGGGSISQLIEQLAFVLLASAFRKPPARHLLPIERLQRRR